MLRASKVIWNAVKKWLFKKWKKWRSYVVDIYFDADHDIAEKVYLVGDFTNPKWSELIPMKYSFFHRSFMAKVKMHDHAQFKFIVDGTFICCPHYPMTFSPEKHTNNVFKINKIKLHSESKSFTDHKWMNFNFNKRTEEAFRKRNTKIINQISNQSFKESNLYWSTQNFKLSYFSPDVRLDNNLSIKESPNSFWQFQNKALWNSTIAYKGKSTLNSTSKSSTSENFNSVSWSKIESKGFMNQMKLSRMITNQSSKTPMTTNFNPLKFGAQKDTNNSHKDDISDLSDEDLFFIDDYFKSNTVVTEDKIYLTNYEGVM